MVNINGKIGVGITTYNSEGYFEALYNSLPLQDIDELIVVNGGLPYKNKYNCNWLQHSKNCYPATCRNDCINFLLTRECDHIFLIEDDMIIKDKDIFKQYIKTSEETGLKYFSFVSTSANTGTPLNRTPRATVEFKNDVKVCLYRNMCNEFTYHHRSCFEKIGLYDKMREAFDVEMTYRECKVGEWTPPFWWFPDIYNSDLYIENNPEGISRLQSKREDGSREEIIGDIWKYFKRKHGIFVHEIPDVTKEFALNQLKQIYNNKVV